MPINNQHYTEKSFFKHVICGLASFAWLVMVAITRLLEMPNCSAIERMYMLFADANFVSSGLGISILIAFAGLSVDSKYCIRNVICLVLVAALLLAIVTLGAQLLSPSEWLSNLWIYAISANDQNVYVPVSPLIAELMTSISPFKSAWLQAGLLIVYISGYCGVYLLTAGICCHNLSTISIVVYHVTARYMLDLWPSWLRYTLCGCCFIQNYAPWCPLPAITINSSIKLMLLKLVMLMMLVSIKHHLMKLNKIACIK